MRELENNGLGDSVELHLMSYSRIVEIIKGLWSLVATPASAGVGRQTRGTFGLLVVDRPSRPVLIPSNVKQATQRRPLALDDGIHESDRVFCMLGTPSWFMKLAQPTPDQQPSHARVTTVLSTLGTRPCPDHQATWQLTPSGCEESRERPEARAATRRCYNGPSGPIRKGSWK